MFFKKTKKIIVGILIFGQIAFWPMLVFGQVVGTTVPVTDSNNGNGLGGSAGVIQNGTEQTALSAAFTIYQGCVKAVQAAEQVAAKANVGASTSAVLSPTGNSALLSAMTALDNAYSLYLACANAQLIVFTGTGGINTGLKASSIYTGNMKQQFIDQINSGIATYTKKQGDLDARIDNANQGFWKTLLISMLLQTSKAVADTLVTKLVNNYKITNLKQYADSAATLMYDNQFIRENFPNNQDQLIARSILENPTFRYQIPSGVFAAADAALGYNPAAVNSASPNFYGQMAAAGSASANPYFLHAMYVGSVDQSHASAMATAQYQISQGSGYKAPVNCAGSLNQQKQIDAQAIALQKQLDDRKRLLDSLTQANTLSPGSVKPADLLQATSDYNAAYNTWNSAPDAVVSKSGSTSTAAAIIMCEAISSPAVLVNQGIDSIFQGLSHQALSQYNGNNLPAYINTITGIASQIGTSMILGGAGAGARSALLNEDKAVNATAVLAGQMAAAKSSSNIDSGFTYNQTAGVNNSTVLNWQTITYTLTTASYVTISGPGVSSSTRQSLSGSITLMPPTNSVYVLTVFDPTGKSLASYNINVSSASQQSFNSNPNAPAVAGAFTQRPAIQTRGPLPVFSLRGP